jgi:hypothetical protein
MQNPSPVPPITIDSLPMARDIALWADGLLLVLSRFSPYFLADRSSKHGRPNQRRAGTAGPACDFALEDATKGKEFEHRLMDYNNLPSTKFDDIRRVLKVATDPVARRLENQKKKP